MVAESKCLSFHVIVCVVTFTSVHLCSCKPRFGYPDTGDISSSTTDKEILGEDKHDHSGDKSDYKSPDKREWRNKFAAWGRKRWGKFPIWGKRSLTDEHSPVDVAQADHADHWNKQSSEQEAEGVHSQKRKWTGLAAWGKRGDTPTDKREWSQFASWGKRDAETADMDKRKWSQFATWGKRGDDDHATLSEDDKRKWSQFSSWGKRDDDELNQANKRKWSQFSSWGKRAGNDELDTLNEADKRKWSQFSSWGKRDDSNDLPPLNEADKRKWSQFSSWGKRDDNNELTPLNEADKRKWSQFSSWGKRDGNTEALKRKWSQFTPWGKRVGSRWSAFSRWGKRRWAGLQMWGKRSVDQDDAILNSVVSKLLSFFDKNEDEVLDKEELRNYIHTLMSIPLQHPDEKEVAPA